MSIDTVIKRKTQSTIQEQLSQPKLYVIILVAKVEEGSFVITLCPNCFIEFFKTFPGKQYIIITPHDCFNDLKSTGKTIITKPLSKQIAETYALKNTARFHSKSANVGFL
jgi:hypothetical protein